MPDSAKGTVGTAKKQILKAREDHGPITLVGSQTKDGPPQFSLSPDSSCAWSKLGEVFGTEKLRARIEPWLTALVQSEHLSLLVGSGLTHAINSIAASKGSPGMDAVKFTAMSEEIESEATRSAGAAHRKNGNFEDQVRAATELLRGMEILAASKPKGSTRHESVKALKANIQEVLTSFADSILQGEHGLATAANREIAFNYLVSFLMSFASRTGTRERLHLFTTNYDRVLEAGADVAGLRLVDRFVGTLAPIFRSSRLDVDLHYNPPGIRGEPRYLEGVARFTKLHGSVDWIDCDDTIKRIGLPLGAADIKPYLSAPGQDGGDVARLMIYPNAAKDRETSAYPYVELFRDLAAATCRPNSTVVCYGYSFGDEHINRVLEDMLTIPSTHLVVISWGDPLDRIMRTYNRLGRPDQITLLIGDHLGDLRTLVDNYLPKSAIDKATFRMAELLKARWGAGPRSDDKAESEGAVERKSAP